jgi:Peptidase family M28
MTMKEIIEGICQFPQRGAGTESEKRASEFVFSLFEKEGFAPRDHAFTTWAEFYLSYVIHLVAAIVLGLVSFCCPLLGTAGLIVVLISFYGDLTTRWYWLRRVLPEVQSRHIYGTVGPEDAKRTIVLSGHYDAGQISEMIFKPESVLQSIRMFKKYFNSAPFPFVLLFGGMIFLLIAALMRLSGGEGSWANGFTWAGSIICGIGTISHLSFVGKGFSDGANDNASAIATSVEIARRMKDDLPPDTKLIVLAFGCEETMMTGSARAVSEMFSNVDRDNFYVINFEGTGAGKLCYATGEGMIHAHYYDPELVGAAMRLAKTDQFSHMRPYVIRHGGSDALSLTVRGFKAITLFGMDDQDYAPNYHWYTDTPDNIDEDALEQSVKVGIAMIGELTR